MIVLVIIGLTSISSFMAFSNRMLFEKLLFNASCIYEKNEWYRFFTHGLIHADFGHLLLNMFVLYSFGTALESYYFGPLFGTNAPLVFALLYVTALPISSMYSYFKNKFNAGYSAVGASGAVAAVVFSAILISPISTLWVWFIPVKAFIFGVLYLVYSWYMDKKGNDSVGHSAHFWGAIYGLVFTVVLKPFLALNFIIQIKTLLG